MSIQSEIHRLGRNVADAFAAISSKGGTLPEKAVSANLAAAVASIPDFVPVQRAEGSFTVAYDSDWNTYATVGFRPDIVVFQDFYYTTDSGSVCQYQCAVVFPEAREGVDYQYVDGYKRDSSGNWLYYQFPVTQQENGFSVYAYGYYDPQNNWVSPTGEVVSYVALKYTP